MSDDKHTIAMPGDAHEAAEQTAYTNKLAAEKQALEEKDNESKGEDSKDQDK